ncbi:uncharacterized protein LOC127241073 [Andrographis paniculata]|uniref:uncharacterized protein LOC127241073 n=1 Tax=Andrographis paniculata TaxID=175694 RepID=UPI0021E76076|nr:uncharacterized protein LOC127241073 [Andrographis paniculata]
MGGKQLAHESRITRPLDKVEEKAFQIKGSLLLNQRRTIILKVVVEDGAGIIFVVEEEAELMVMVGEILEINVTIKVVIFSVITAKNLSKKKLIVGPKKKQKSKPILLKKCMRRVSCL